MPSPFFKSLIILLILHCINCARILVINSTPSYSHEIAIRPLVKELSRRGHDVVFATTLPMNDPTLTTLKEIDMSFANEFWKEAIAKPKINDIFSMVFDIFDLLVYMNELYVSHPNLQALIKNETEHFDLVLLEFINPTFFAFKHRFNCPFVGYTSLNAPNMDHVMLGNGFNPVLYPDAYFSLDKRDNFRDRFFNFFLTTMLEIKKTYFIYPKIEKIVQNNFGDGYPDINTLYEEVDMLFITANVVLNTVRPVTPSTIYFGGGVHIGESKELPKDLKAYLDNSKHGVIYVSFGSNVHSAQLPDRFKEVLLETFSQLPYDFLWKFEDASLKTIPENIKLMKWVPQQDVLRHKNLKLFITHAGLQSTEEGLFNHIPMLAVPVFADQPFNAHQIASKGAGLMIDDIHTLTKEQLKDSILELTNNSTYVETLKRLTAIAHDQPMAPLEKAVWWTEYVIRHKGAKHLKGPVAPYYQYFLLDIFAFLLVLLLVAIFITYIIFSSLCKRFFRYFKQKKLKSN